MAQHRFRCWPACRRCAARPCTYWAWAAVETDHQACRAEFGFTFGDESRVDLRGFRREQRMIACNDSDLCVIGGQHVKHVFQVECW